MSDPTPDQILASLGRLESKYSNVDSRLTTLEAKFITVESRLTKVETRLETVESRLTKVETRLETVESRLTKVETRLETIESRLLGVETRLDSVESRLAIVESVQKEHSIKLDKIYDSLGRIENILSAYGDMYKANHDQIQNLQKRVGIVEVKLNISSI